MDLGEMYSSFLSGCVSKMGMAGMAEEREGHGMLMKLMEGALLL